MSHATHVQRPGDEYARQQNLCGAYTRGQLPTDPKTFRSLQRLTHWKFCKTCDRMLAARERADAVAEKSEASCPA